MLDYSLPVARRTRRRVDEAYMEYHKKKMKKEEREEESVKNSITYSTTTRSSRVLRSAGRNNQTQTSGSSIGVSSSRFNCDVDSKSVMESSIAIDVEEDERKEDVGEKEKAKSCSDAYENNDDGDVEAKQKEEEGEKEKAESYSEASDDDDEDSDDDYNDTDTDTANDDDEEEEEEEHVIDENRDKCNIGDNAENEEEEKAGTEEGSCSGIPEFIREEENVARVGIGSAERNWEWVESKEEEFIDLTGLDEPHHDDMDIACPSGKKRTHVGLKRKEPSGLDFWVAVDNKKWDPVESKLERNRFGQFTSSHFDSYPMKKKMAFGEKELKSTPYLDDGHFARKTKSYAEMDKPKQGSGSKEEFAKYKKRWRKGALKTHEVLKVLADSLLDGREMPLEDWSSNPKAGLLTVNEVVLPSKFTFGDEEPIILDKSEAEKEICDLFLKMEYALRCSEIGSTDFNMVSGDGNAPPRDETGIGSFCREGKHQLRLDEELGLVCRFCSHVELEIRFIVPSFGKNVWGKSEYSYRGRMEKRLFDEFKNEDVGFQSESGSDVDYNSQATAWDLIPGIKQSMYPHQREGFEFIWKNVAGGILLDKIKDGSTNTGGCIISHAPGTGKTRLTIVFLQSYMKLFPNCKPVIVAPRSMLLTWEEEFKKWNVDIPFHILNSDELSGNESATAIGFQNGARDSRVIRVTKLYSWRTHKSVLGISYQLFERLAGENDRKVVEGYEYENVKALLLDTPDLVIFDEGHTPRNDQSRTFKALFKVKTERRIILSGTPFQNNFDELYNTLCMVRPSFMDRISSKKPARYALKKRGRKTTEAKEKWTSLTGSIGKVSGCRLASASIEELRAMIAPFVHIHKGNILQQTLPGLKHAVVVLQPGPMQKSLLDVVQGTKNSVMLDVYVSLVSVHPSLLPTSFDNEPCVDRCKLEKLRLKPGAGVKTKFLMELLRLTEAVDEKVLVFGQYLDALICIKDQLKSRLNWREGKEVLYMDGQCKSKKRQSCINDFNNPKSEAKIMLASIKACGEGINLVGASRVVLLDVVWNPSVERQAISRAYRIGQEKVVYIYRLITSGTTEEGKCCRQAEKDRLSELVFCSPSEGENLNQYENNNTSITWEDNILQEMNQHERLKSMFRKIIYEQPKESDFLEDFVEDGTIFNKECYF